MFTESGRWAAGKGDPMRRSVVVSILALGVLVVMALPAHAAPTNKWEPFDVDCGGTTVAVISPAEGNSSWTIDTSTGETSKTPKHIKEISFRIHEGVLTVEPSTAPIFTFEKTFGNRVGQGDATHCTGRDLCPCGTQTGFYDVWVTGL